MIVIRDDNRVAVEAVAMYSCRAADGTYNIHADSTNGEYTMGGGYTEDEAKKIVLTWAIIRHTHNYADMTALLKFGEKP